MAKIDSFLVDPETQPSKSPLENPNNIPQHIQDANIFKQFKILVDEYGYDEIQDSINRLNNARNKSLIEEEDIPRLMDELGITLDLSELSIDKRRALLSEIPRLLEVTGSPAYIEFMRWFLGYDFISRVLWTDDYETFTDFKVDENYYRTTRIEFVLPAAENQSRFRELFDQIAPAVDVIHRIITESALDAIQFSVNTRVVVNNTIDLGEAV